MGRAVNALTQFLLRAGPGRLIAALGITAIVAAGVFTLVLRMGGEEKALLFSGVSMQEASEITAKLDQANIPYSQTGDGTTIMVARSKVMDARMMLAADGLPSRGSVGYEIFDRQDALGATQFQQNISRLRALEGELARTIVSIEGVQGARVHLVLPERQLFERDGQDPSASIVLQATAPLTASQVRAIRNLVAGAVPRLSVQRVTILDESGRLLAGGNPDDPSAAAEGIDGRQTAYEERVRKTVQDIVESVVGPGKARVQVSAEMDFNRITSNSETFDPEGRVVRSTQTSEETSQDRDAGSNAATAGRNVPDGTGNAGEAGEQSASSRTEETVNYEISKTTKTEIIEGGRLRRLSVAVAVDGVTTPGAEGQPPQWAARDAAELERLTTLVRSAVGFDEQRGDRVEVVNVRFAPIAVAGTEVKKAGPFDLAQLDMMRGAELIAALIAALAFVFFVLRPLVGGLVRPGAGLPATAGALANPNGAPAGAAAALPGAAGLGQLPSPGGDVAVTQTNNDLNVDLARIRGDVKASSIKQVAEIVQQHPEESVAILRSWLNNAV